MDKLRGVAVVTGTATTTSTAASENAGVPLGGGSASEAEAGPLSTSLLPLSPVLAETSGCNSSSAPACELSWCITEPAWCVDPVVAGSSVEQSPMAHFESSPCGLSDYTLRSNANVQVTDTINAPVDMGPVTQSSSSGESVAPQTVLRS
ncbi:hypothetical protein V6N11_071897 [Hibiscus sabdariffa]|uniref:Uncharacterized protein n=1 Tax=Hibiscus sabdariffa TaxID=183260 RepID=A0ABR2U1F0_9ROSI